MGVSFTRYNSSISAIVTDVLTSGKKVGARERRAGRDANEREGRRNDT